MSDLLDVLDILCDAKDALCDANDALCDGTSGTSSSVNLFFLHRLIASKTVTLQRNRFTTDFVQNIDDRHRNSSVDKHNSVA